MEKMKKGLLLLAIGAACGALCYVLVKNKNDKVPYDLEDDDFEDYDDGFMDEEPFEDDVKVPVTDEATAE